MAEYLDSWSLRPRSKALTPGQRLALALRRDAGAQLIGGMDARLMADGVDVSHWQGSVDLARMKREGGIAFCFPKASDGKQVQAGDPYHTPNYIDDRLYENVQKCYESRIVCGPYHYVQPHLTDYTLAGVIDWNWKVIKQAMDPLTPGISYHMFALDVEEKTASATNGSDVVLELRQRIGNDPKLSRVPLVIYTSMSVLNYYVKLREQISYPGAEANLWMAQWVWNQATSTSWEGLKENYIPKIDMRVLTPGYQTWQFLQWSSSFILPGCGGRTDVNKFKGAAGALFDWLGFDGEPPKVEEPEEPGQPGDLEAVRSIVARIDEKVGEIRAKFSD